MWEAASNGGVEEVEGILRKDPGVDPNWRNEGEYGRAAIHVACENDHGSIVSILLAHPDIDVNLRNNGGWTPFLTACANSVSCARLLLKDPRVDVMARERNSFSALWWALNGGNVDVIKWWIASGREIDLGTPGDHPTDAIGAAKKKGYLEAATLLERFKEHPEETRYATKVELGCHSVLAAEMFALVVFVSDEFLRISQGNHSTRPAARFFSVAARLPLELQMFMCRRVLGSAKEIISGKDCELAIKDLAKCLK